MFLCVFLVGPVEYKPNDVNNKKKHKKKLVVPFPWGEKEPLGVWKEIFLESFCGLGWERVGGCVGGRKSRAGVEEVDCEGGR